jgi:phosphoglycerol transferase MdoB-like AlkP superfamily enzyme
MFLNHTAVNAVWNVGTTAFNKKPVKNPYQFEDKDIAKAIVKSLRHDRGEPVKVLNNQKPNILIIVIEGFSGYVVGAVGGDQTITPYFNKFAEEGILFTEFYASGNRTDKAMPAILNGYPSQPTYSIMKEPKKSQSLPSLVRILTNRGYKSSFWYGGNINFANFKSFIIGSGFQSMITENNFNSQFYNSKWGVHDHIMFNALQDSMQNPHEPFLTVVLTLSSHEPFEAPMETVIKGNDNISKYKNSVVYADKSLGEFITWAKTTEWWANTLVILVADHCARVSESQPVYSPELFKIPMLWIGGALDTTGIKITKHGDQTDIPLTVFGQLGISAEFPFGKDLLSPESASFAFYVYNEGLGFLTDSTKYIYDHKMKNHIVKEDDFSEKAGKAYLQVLFDDYLER